MATVNVRYMVHDVEAAVAWYTQHRGFSLLSSMAPAFADVARGPLRLLLSGPSSSAGRPMPDGERPGPGGWNRIHLIVDDLPAEVARLRAGGVQFRNDIVKGRRIADPAGGPVRQPRRAVPASRSLTRHAGLTTRRCPLGHNPLSGIGEDPQLWGLEFRIRDGIALPESFRCFMAWEGWW